MASSIQLCVETAPTRFAEALIESCSSLAAAFGHNSLKDGISSSSRPLTGESQLWFLVPTRGRTKRNRNSSVPASITVLNTSGQIFYIFYYFNFTLIEKLLLIFLLRVLIGGASSLYQHHVSVASKLFCQVTSVSNRVSKRVQRVEMK